MANNPILDLETLIKRPTIKIDGKSFEIRTPDELSVLESAWFSKKGREIAEAAKQDNQDEVETLMAEVVGRCVVDLPEDVLTKLSGAHKAAISELFTQLLSQHKTQVTGAIAMAVLDNRTLANQPIGGKSSLGSSVSSAAIRSGGSEKRPQHS